MSDQRRSLDADAFERYHRHFVAEQAYETRPRAQDPRNFGIFQPWQSAEAAEQAARRRAQEPRHLGLFQATQSAEAAAAVINLDGSSEDDEVQEFGVGDIQDHQAGPSRDTRTRDREDDEVESPPAEGTNNNESVLLRCPVCLNSCANRVPVSTRCGHIFCEACLKIAFNVNKACPICRKELDGRADFIKIFLN